MWMSRRVEYVCVGGDLDRLRSGVSSFLRSAASACANMIMLRTVVMVVLATATIAMVLLVVVELALFVFVAGCGGERGGGQQTAAASTPQRENADAASGGPTSGSKLESPAEHAFEMVANGVRFRSVAGERTIVSGEIEVDADRALVTMKARSSSGLEFTARAIGDATMTSYAEANASATAAPSTAVHLEVRRRDGKDQDVVFEGVAYTIANADDRSKVAERLSSTVYRAAFDTFAPYRTALVARVPASKRIFDLFAPLIGIDAAWPNLDEPDDLNPPGMIEGDSPGLGMRCASSIKCPNPAPFCVTANHEETYGFCTRACETTEDCAGAVGAANGAFLCNLPVSDVPGVPTSIRACAKPSP
jgi:hypothetical protein